MGDRFTESIRLICLAVRTYTRWKVKKNMFEKQCSQCSMFEKKRCGIREKVCSFLLWWSEGRRFRSYELEGKTFFFSAYLQRYEDDDERHDDHDEDRRAVQDNHHGRYHRASCCHPVLKWKDKDKHQQETKRVVPSVCWTLLLLLFLRNRLLSNVIFTWMFRRKSASIVSTSLEKRLMIRPRGVVSKKLIGQRIMFCRSSQCSFFEAAIAP